ncbi:MAG TPA: hypothetical protein VIJ20_07480 [Solirubrobacteraceae bacterium]
MSRCQTCGTVLGAGDAFCGDCGAAAPTATTDVLAAAVETRSAETPRPPAPPPRPAVAPAPEPIVGPPMVDTLGDIQMLGSAEPNATYLGQRLQYERQTEAFDISAAFAAAASLRRTASLALFYFVIPGLPVALIVDSVGGSRLFELYMLLLLIACGLIWISPLLRRHHFVLSEWKLSLDGKGANAYQVFEHIAAAVVRRGAPMQYRVVTLADGQRYLNLRLATYDAYVACIAFGDDLYVGWTLWASATWREMRQRPIPLWRLLLLMPYYVWLDVKASLSGQSFDVAMIHQFDIVKAMRECLHAVTREGVQAAAGVVPYSGAGTIGSAVPEGPSPTFAGTSMELPRPQRGHP